MDDDKIGDDIKGFDQEWDTRNVKPGNAWENAKAGAQADKMAGKVEVTNSESHSPV